MTVLMAAATLNAKPVDFKRASDVAIKASYVLFQEQHPEMRGLQVVPYYHFEAEKSPYQNIYCFDMYYTYEDSCVAVGFIVVSGDDVAAPILAFSTDQRYPSQINPSAKAMLDSYDQQIAAAKTKGVRQDANVAAKWARLESIDNWNDVVALTAKGDIYDDNIPRLLGNMSWGQGKPYNDKCPGKSVTGCVATAFSMIMNYWNWPEHGWGSHSYNGADNPAAYGNWTYGVQSADFEHTYYDWDNMPDMVMINDDQAIIDAVSTLCYHVGVALDMNYNPNGSGTWSLPEYAMFDTSMHLEPTVGAHYRIPKHFGYKYSYAGMRDSVHNDSLWLRMLYNSLAEGKPIYYAGWAKENNEAGHSATSGHGYVLDGYFSDVTDSNYFYINWGWSGSYNGFFKLDAMTPGGSDFTQWHGAIIGLEPDSTYIGYDPAAIQPFAPASSLVWSEMGQVKVNGCANQSVAVFDMMGRLVAQRNASADDMWRVQLQSGAYVVKVGSQMGQKVVVLR